MVKGDVHVIQGEERVGQVRFANSARAWCGTCTSGARARYDEFGDDGGVAAPRRRSTRQRHHVPGDGSAEDQAGIRALRPSGRRRLNRRAPPAYGPARQRRRVQLGAELAAQDVELGVAQRPRRSSVDAGLIVICSIGLHQAPSPACVPRSLANRPARLRRRGGGGRGGGELRAQSEVALKAA